MIEVQSFDIYNQLNLHTAFITLVFTADWLPVITYPAPPQMVVKVFENVVSLGINFCKAVFLN